MYLYQSGALLGGVLRLDVFSLEGGERQPKVADVYVQDENKQLLGYGRSNELGVVAISGLKAGAKLSVFAIDPNNGMELVGKSQASIDYNAREDLAFAGAINVVDGETLAGEIRILNGTAPYTITRFGNVPEMLQESIGRNTITYSGYVNSLGSFTAEVEVRDAVGRVGRYSFAGEFTKYGVQPDLLWADISFENGQWNDRTGGEWTLEGFANGPVFGEDANGPYMKMTRQAFYQRKYPIRLPVNTSYTLEAVIDRTEGVGTLFGLVTTQGSTAAILSVLSNGTPSVFQHNAPPTYGNRIMDGTTPVPETGVQRLVYGRNIGVMSVSVNKQVNTSPSGGALGSNATTFAGSFTTTTTGTDLGFKGRIYRMRACKIALPTDCYL